MKAAVFQVLIGLLIVSVSSSKSNTKPGGRQSPIDINTDKAVPIKKVGQRQLDIFYNYPPNSTVVVYKDEHSVKLVPARISNDFLIHYSGDNYIFAELHFHWGVNDSEGSEHTLNKKRYSMEAHLVFYKLMYGTKEEAMKKPDGFIVIGVFLQAGGADNSLFESVSRIITQMEDSDDSITVTGVEAYNWVIESFGKKSKYYTYLGSLTTPPYSENVQWFVFESTIPISSEQIEPFRRLTYEGKELTPNYRETQPLNYRTVYSSRYFKLYAQ